VIHAGRESEARGTSILGNAGVDDLFHGFERSRDSVRLAVCCTERSDVDGSGCQCTYLS
jgi:hypothetical protein